MNTTHEMDPMKVLVKLQKELNEVNAKIDQTLKKQNLEVDEIDLAIEFLNTAIRQLDYAVEDLIESKNVMLA
jgi:DNA repair exonuclease SbcCD ATPase subunit